RGVCGGGRVGGGAVVVRCPAAPRGGRRLAGGRQPGPPLGAGESPSRGGGIALSVAAADFAGATHRAVATDGLPPARAPRATRRANPTEAIAPAPAYFTLPQSPAGTKRDRSGPLCC